MFNYRIHNPHVNTSYLNPGTFETASEAIEHAENYIQEKYYYLSGFSITRNETLNDGNYVFELDEIWEVTVSRL